MNLTRLLLNTLALRAREFEEATKDPLRAQEKLLLEYIRRNSQTEYGLKYDFSRINFIDEYQARAPLINYETVRPYIDRMAKGERNILTKDAVTFFATTSGTTNRSKLIPETKYSQDKKSDLINLWAYYIARDHPDIFDGKVMAIISPEIEGHTEAGIPCGAESGHTYKAMLNTVKRLYALPYEVFEIKDYPARYYCILRFGMERRDITSISTLNPISIILLCQKINDMQNAIIDDIKNGTLAKSLPIPPDIRRSLEKSLKPDPERASELDDILRSGKELLPKYIWPNLKLIECWKAGSVKPLLKEMPRYFGDLPIRDMGCVSSETRSSIPISDEGTGGILAINTNFYEFIPKEDADREKKRTLLCHQIEKGGEYFIIVTTPSGLYRYDIDDIIRVDGFFNRTPVIEFEQKGLYATSIAGEKLYETHVVEAMNNALTKNKLTVNFFCAIPLLENVPHYTVLAEFTGNPTREDKRRLLWSLENELHLQNEEYAERRKAEALGPPVLKVVRRGDFEKYRLKRMREGAHDGQFKAPELTPDPKFQDNFTIEEEVPFLEE